MDSTRNITRIIALGGLAALIVLSGAGHSLAAERSQGPSAEGVSPPPLALSTTPELPAGETDYGAATKKHKINLWPFLYYQQDPVGQTKEFNLLGPFIRFGETPKESYFALSPLYYTRTEKKTKDAEADFLWPYGSFKRRGGDEETRLSPFFESDKDDSPRWGLFPIYGGRSSKGESYGGVFPFFGTIKERFGQDEGSFVLFPLFAQSRRDDTTTTHVLWPFFSSTQGTETEGFKAWPFFGWKKDKGRSESSFAMWPFWVERRRGLDTDNPERFWMLFPFYGETKSPERDGFTALWPFINYAKDKKHDYTTFSLFPLLTIVHGSDREAFKLLPLFGYEKTKSNESSFLVAPFIYGTKSLRSRDFTERQTRWLFFSKDRERTWTKTGETAKLFHFWPFIHYKKSRQGAVQVAFPSLFPVVSDKFQRNWPFLTLYGYRRTPDGSESSSILWNLFSSQKDDSSSSWELAYLLDYSEDEASEVKEFSFLKGLFSYRSSEEGNRYGFLYLPWGITTHPKEAPETTVAAKEPPKPEEPEKTAAVIKISEPELPLIKSPPRQRLIFESVH